MRQQRLECSENESKVTQTPGNKDEARFHKTSVPCNLLFHLPRATSLALWISRVFCLSLLVLACMNGYYHQSWTLIDATPSFAGNLDTISVSSGTFLSSVGFGFLFFCFYCCFVLLPVLSLLVRHLSSAWITTLLEDAWISERGHSISEQHYLCEEFCIILSKICQPINSTSWPRFVSLVRGKWLPSPPQYNRRADLPPWVSVPESLKFNKAVLSQEAFRGKSQTQDLSSVPVWLTVAMGMGRGCCPQALCDLIPAPFLGGPKCLLRFL